MGSRSVFHISSSLVTLFVSLLELFAKRIRAGCRHDLNAMMKNQAQAPAGCRCTRVNVKRISLAAASIVMIFTCAQIFAQTRHPERNFEALSSKAQQVQNPLSGKWTYRSFYNRPSTIVDQDAQLALGLIFGEGVMTFENSELKLVKGIFDMGGGYVIDLTGDVRWETYATPTIFSLIGIGRKGTPTEGWQYDYVGYLAWKWPDGIGQVPSIVGTVLRAKPHGSTKAGYTASFIANKQP
jgi:hypothetical protein